MVRHGNAPSPAAGNAKCRGGMTNNRQGAEEVQHSQRGVGPGWAGRVRGGRWQTTGKQGVGGNFGVQKGDPAGKGGQRGTQNGLGSGRQG